MKSLNEQTVNYIGRAITVFAIAVFVFDLLTGGDLSETSRLIVMGIAAVTYLGVFAKQCKVAYAYEGAPIVYPLPFRYVVAQWLGVTGALITWFLVVALWPHIFNVTVSHAMWSIFAVSNLFFFGRWIALGRPQFPDPYGYAETTGDREKRQDDTQEVLDRTSLVLAKRGKKLSDAGINLDSRIIRIGEKEEEQDHRGERQNSRQVSQDHRELEQDERDTTFSNRPKGENV